MGIRIFSFIEINHYYHILYMYAGKEYKQVHTCVHMSLHLRINKQKYTSFSYISVNVDQPM